MPGVKTQVMTTLKNRAVADATWVISQLRIIVLRIMKVTNKVTYPVKKVPRLSIIVGFQCS